MDKNIYGNVSLYIPKHERNFMRICQAYAEKEYPDTSWSQFVIMCIKTYINRLSREEKKAFEEQAWKLAQLEKPKTSEFVDKFIKNM